MFKHLSDVDGRRLKVGGEERGVDFARKYFPGCKAHTSEAVAVHRSLEFLCRRQLGELNPDNGVCDILGDPAESWRCWFRAPREGSDDPQLLIPLQLTPRVPVINIPDATAVNRWTEAVFHCLLGPVAKLTMWTAETIWTRPIRGVINEGVRRARQCTCLNDLPPDSGVQRTSD